MNRWLRNPSRGLVLLAVALLVAAAWSLRSRRPVPPEVDAADDASANVARRVPRPTAGWDDAPLADADAHGAAVCGSVLESGTDAVVEGAVVSLHPRALRGAHSMLVPGGGRRSFVGRTGSEGQWRLDDVPMSADTAWTVSVTAEGFRPVVLPAEGRCDDAPLTVRLEPGGVLLHGTVRDATGGALAGAVVQLVPSDQLATGAEQVAASTTTTGEDGRYRISVDPGLYRVEARFPDYAADTRWVRVAAATRRDFALLPGARVEGLVVRGEGDEPVPFARVVMTAVSGQPTTGADAAAITDAQGRFVIEGLEPGELELHAYAESGRTASGTVVELGPGGYRAGLELRLEAAPAAYGMVVERADGSTPVKGASVLARSDAGIWVSKPTDAAGAFMLPALAPGEYQLSVEAPAHVPNHLAATLRVADGDVEGLVLELDAGATVSGQVLEGGPDTSVRVEVDLEGIPPAQGMPLIGNAFASTRCDAEGYFSLGPVTPGVLTLVAEDPTRGTGRVQASVTLDEDPPVVIALSAETGVEGRVLDAGQPRQGLTIAAVRLDRPASVVPPPAQVSAAQASVLTDGDGGFRHAGLEPGTYHLQVLDGASVLPVAGEPPVVEVPDQGWVNVSIALADRSGVLRGEVVDVDGSPIADAVVRATLASLSVERTLTDEDGAFLLEGLPEGEALHLRVTDASPGGAFVDQDAQVGDAVRVEMPRGATVAVTVRGVGVGRLSLRGPRAAEHALRKDGTARFVRLPAGEYVLEATGEEGYGVETFTLDGSDTTIAIRGDGWAVVEGTLSEALGEVEGWTVFAADAEGRVGAHELSRALLGHATRTDADGAFELSRVAPRSGRITLTPPEGAAARPITLSIDPRPGQRLDLGEVAASESPT